MNGVFFEGVIQWLSVWQALKPLQSECKHIYGEHKGTNSGHLLKAVGVKVPSAGFSPGLLLSAGQQSSMKTI
jgi:hypothetical protein